MKNIEKPAYAKGIMWFLFSATAMASAFFLPVHIWISMSAFRPQYTLIGKIYFLLVIFCGLYHGLYRTKTILADLGLGRYAKISGGILIALFTFGIGLAGYLSFWYL